MYPSESSTSSASWGTAVWKANHPSTWPTSASHGPQSRLGSVSDPPGDNFWIYRATGRVLVPDGLLCGRPVGLQLIARVYLRDPARPSAETVSENSWKRFCLQRTNAYSALEVFTTMRYTNSHYITLLNFCAICEHYCSLLTWEIVQKLTQVLRTFISGTNTSSQTFTPFTVTGASFVNGCLLM